jgi:iduronate 2-sulfatase
MWCKQTNYDLVARIPMLVKAPHLSQSRGVRSRALVEAVDLMPTLLELAGVVSPADTARVWDFQQLEGVSLAPLLAAGEGSPSSAAAAPSASFRDHAAGAGSPVTGPVVWKNATFSQYPRCTATAKGGGLEPWEAPSDDACTGTSSAKFSAMGYSIRDDQYRYTLWVKWNGAKLAPVWDQIVGEDLFDHAADTGFDTDEAENANLASATVPGSDAPAVLAAKARLKQALLAGWKHALPPRTAS